MTEMWEQNRPFSVAVLLWTAGWLVFFLAVHLPFSAPVSRLNADTGVSRSYLAKHYESAASAAVPGMPFENAKKAAEALEGRLKAALAAARAQVEFQPRAEFKIKPDVAQRAFEYTKIRDALVPRLRELANKASVAIPAELDPRPSSKDLPRETEADELVFRLAMTDRIIRAAGAAQVPRLATLTHKLGAPRGAPLAEREAAVRLEGGLDSIIRFIAECSAPGSGAPPESKDEPGGILAVRSAEISANGDTALTADLTLVAITFVEVKPKSAPKVDTEPPRRAHRSF